MTTGRRTAEERLSRLLVMLPWLMEQGEVPLADVARRYGMSEADVARDLELAAMCGLPPFVDEMIDVFIDDDTVFVGVPRLFTRPLRLTAPEGFALVAAGRAAMQLPGADPDGPLGRGLEKLAAALGDDAVVVDLPIAPGLAATIEEISAATTTAARLRIEYWTPSRDETTERTITPRRVFNDRGEWYVVADDGRSGERRTFRVDRIESLTATGDHDTVEPVPAAVAERDWFADAGLRRVTLRLSPAGAVGGRAVPGRRRRRAPRRQRSTPRSPSPASAGWSGCSCASGPTPRSASPPSGATLGRDVARRVLARYAESGSGE